MSVTLKPYPEYKDSGVPWLGKIPKHWSANRLKQVCRLGYGDSLPSEARLSGDVPVYGSNGCVGYHNASNTLGPCIIIGRKGSFGKVNYSPQPAFAIDTTFFVDARLTKESLRWLYYVLSWVRLDDASRDSAIPGLDRGEAYERIIPAAPMEEQRQIAAFLDSHDHLINRLIHAKRRLIKLLNEQKQIIIHRAVTRGLAPNVHLKSSGIDWLGDVPEHWEVSWLKFLASHVVDCLHATPEYVPDGEYPAIRTADIEPGHVSIDTAKRVTREQYLLWTSRLVPQAGDVLYTREGERYGLAALVPSKVDLCISQRMMLFRIRKPHSSEFVMWQLNCPHVYAQASADLIGATSPHVNVERIRNYALVVPPPKEQAEIAAWIEEHCRAIETGRLKAVREINLLHEYRTRLITDVVTGKLDVQGVELSALDEADALAEWETDEDTEVDEMDVREGVDA